VAALSDYLENALLNHVLRNVAYTSPSGVWVALFTNAASAAQLEAGTLTNEVSGGAYTYARQSVTFAAPSGGATANSGVLTWTNMPGVTVSYAAVVDASSVGTGNILVYGGLVTPKTLNPGDTFAVATSDFDVVLS
jgi:hypothetical protein